MKAEPVSSLLQALRDAEAAIGTPPHVEAGVLAAWDAAHAVPGASGSSRTPPPVESGVRRTSFAVWQRAGAIAAAVILAFTLSLLGGALRTELVPSVPGGSTMVLVGEPILQGEPVRVVRMRVPASTLSALGVRSMTGDPGDSVDVDVIVGEDGVARAIRVGM